jgi:hypothetical protein
MTPPTAAQRQAVGSAAHVQSNLLVRAARRDKLELPVSECVIGSLWAATTTMRTGSAGKQRYAGKKRKKLAATRWMRQAGYDLPMISISGRSNYTAS